MPDKKLKQEVDTWENRVNDFIQETRKASKQSAKDLDKRLKVIQGEGRKLGKSVDVELVNADKEMKKVLDDLGKRLEAVQDKLNRAWDELQK